MCGKEGMGACVAGQEANWGWAGDPRITECGGFGKQDRGLEPMVRILGNNSYCCGPRSLLQSGASVQVPWGIDRRLWDPSP